MNKRYMDFVPKEKAKKIVEKSNDEIFYERSEIDEIQLDELLEMQEKKPQAGISIDDKPKKVLKTKDYREKFVKTEVKKRPLNVSKELSEAKSKRVSRMSVLGKKAVKPAERLKLNTNKDKRAVKSVENLKRSATESEKTMKLPKPLFVNTEKVVKRPLSKNIYQRDMTVAPESPSGPVTIIDRPEKDSKIGLVVTIIITIILGAAAGTVAFLLLPK